MSSAALMSPPHTVRVGDAVTLHILQTDRFKTARLSISAILPADQVLSPRMTLLFGVLRRGSSRFPGQLHINRRLDELYGATLTIRNFHAGDRQVLGFTAEMLDDSCLPAADRGLDILGGVADLLAGLILEPLTDEDGVLRRRSVEQEKQAGHKVIMIGDGINDSPALSAADVGIAISEGAQIAREIADVTIGADNLQEVATLKELSNALMARIHKNYRMIVGINTGLIILGVAGIIPPTTSALLHNTSTLWISTKSMKNLLDREEA